MTTSTEMFETLSQAVQRFQHVYFLMQEEMKALNGSTPDEDQVIQALLESEDHLDEIDKEFLASLTYNQRRHMFKQSIRH